MTPDQMDAQLVDVIAKWKVLIGHRGHCAADDVQHLRHAINETIDEQLEAARHGHEEESRGYGHGV